tara:strand:- start:733 stop:2679 length:1947 start_codon:yes stop_codon:yes gene_type:complete
MTKKRTLKFPTNFQSEITKSSINKFNDRSVWDISLLFLEGRQWASYGTNIMASQGIAMGSAAGQDYKITVNLLLNIYRNLLSKLATTYPGIVVSPASPSTEDILKAQSSEMALRYYWNQGNVKNMLGKAFEWLLSTGTVGLHSYYDPDIDEAITEVVNPFDLIFEPYVSCPDDSQWVGIRRHVAKADLIKTFPKSEEEISEASDNYSPANRPGNASLKQAPADRAEIFEIYWKDGKHGILLGNHYLYRGENQLNRIPIEILRYTQVPGKLWGVGLIAPLIDMQWLYNKSRSQVLKNIELMSNPKWLIPKSAGVNPNAITNRPGEKVYYNAAGGAPTQIGAAALPSHVFDNITRLQSEMMDVSGIHSTSLGKRAVGITSGKAMQTMAELDMSQLQQTQLRVEDRMTKVAENILGLMKLYYTEDRMVRMFDATGQIVFRQISNLDITGAPEVFIEAGSLFRSEAQDRDKKVYDMLELGLIQPETAIKELSFRTGNKYVMDKMTSLAHANDLLKAATMGYDIEVFNTDDLDAFKQVFGDYIRSPVYYQLSEERQEYIRDVFIALENAMMEPKDAASYNLQDKIFPRSMKPSTATDEQLTAIMSQGSGGAQEQMLEEVVEQRGMSTGFGAAEDVVSQRAEALISNRSPGGMG